MYLARVQGSLKLCNNIVVSGMAVFPRNNEIIQQQHSEAIQLQTLYITQYVCSRSKDIHPIMPEFELILQCNTFDSPSLPAMQCSSFGVML